MTKRLKNDSFWSKKAEISDITEWFNYKSDTTKLENLSKSAVYYVTNGLQSTGIKFFPMFIKVGQSFSSAGASDINRQDSSLYFCTIKYILI